VQFHFDDGKEGQKLNAKEILKKINSDTHLYVCGPKGFMDYIIQTAKELGWPESQIHYEFFKAEVATKDDDGSFEVELASTGQVVKVPADMTIAYALIEAGVAVPLSCEQGICGTCVMKIVDGVPDHRDVCLSDDDKEIKKMFTPCCSRAASTRLVLDF
jgi:vanillate O-demethylase ferredoxin subunit